MISSLELLVVGPSIDFVQGVVDALSEHAMAHATGGLIEKGRVRVLSQSEDRPNLDAVLLCMSPGTADMFAEPISAFLKDRPLVFAVCTEYDVELMRKAMQLGARDIFQLPISSEDILETIKRLVLEEQQHHLEDNAGTKLTAFINAKGGSGASFIAANVAMDAAKFLGEHTKGKGQSKGQLLLMDLDFQFGGLPTYLSLNATDGLLRALEFADSLDATQLRGFVQKHELGVDLLAATMDDIMLAEEISVDRMTQLLSVIAGEYPQMIVDLPRRIDTAVATLLHHADTIIVVTQQSVAHLHDAKRLIFLLRERIGIDAKRIELLINRYQNSRDVGVEEYTDSFPNIRIETLPSDYLRASSSINLGIAISEMAPRSALGKGMVTLAKNILESGTTKLEAEPKKGLFKWFRGG